MEQEGHVRRIAIYFRDLDNGPWFGVREKDLFLLASLVKVPIIMACLKQAEHDPSFLKKRVRFLGMTTEFEDQYFPPGEILEPGKDYSVEDLIRRTARYSDNSSALLLMEAMDQNVLDRIFRDLGVSLHQTRRMEATLSAKDYGTFFRILYNATYLNQEMSEQALEFFAEAAFKGGLVAGVPPGITVAHKFGQAGYVSRKEVQGQLHDCGIIYHPDRPYLLCVMTEGDDFDRLAEAIASISRFIYGEVERQGKEQPFSPGPPAMSP